MLSRSGEHKENQVRMCGLKEEELSKMKVVVGYFVVLKTIWGITSLA